MPNIEGGTNDNVAVGNQSSSPVNKDTLIKHIHNIHTAYERERDVMKEASANKVDVKAVGIPEPSIVRSTFNQISHMMPNERKILAPMLLDEMTAAPKQKQVKVATIEGNSEKAEYQVDAKQVKMNQKGTDGHYPIYHAAGSIEATRYLIAAKVDVNAKSNTGETAIFNSVTVGRKEVTQSLIDNGAKTNIIDNKGNNLLHVIARNHRDSREEGVGGNDRDLRSIVKSLLEQPNKPDINAKNKEGKTPLDSLNTREDKGNITMLREAFVKLGAKTSEELGQGQAKAKQETKENGLVNKIITNIKSAWHAIKSVMNTVADAIDLAKTFGKIEKNSQESAKQGTPQKLGNHKNTPPIPGGFESPGASPNTPSTPKTEKHRSP